MEGLFIYFVLWDNRTKNISQLSSEDIIKLVLKLVLDKFEENISTC